MDVFVIMPFQESPTRGKEQLTSFFKNELRTPIEEADELEYDYRVYRSGQDFNITNQIIRDLYHADIVIADLSGVTPNPNVMYELGVRLALSNDPVILIREDHKDNREVFDVDHYYIYPYDPLDYPSLQSHLVNKIRRFETGEESYTSPVSNALGTELALQRGGLKDVSPDQQTQMVVRGISHLTSTLSRSYGPRGTSVRVPSHAGERRSTRQGVEICEAVSSSNPYEQVGIDLLHTVSDELDEEFGDGTKLAPLLTGALIEESHEALRTGADRASIVRGIEEAASHILDYLDDQALLANSKQDVVSVAATASGSETMGKRTADILESIGKDGTVTVELGDIGRDDEILTRSGYHLPEGYADPVLSENGETWTADNCTVLLYAGRITSMNDLLPILEKVKANGKPLLIITGDIGDEARSTLVINRTRGSLNSIAVSLRGTDNLEARLEDVAAGSGATVISEEKGRQLHGASHSDLGVLESVQVTDSTTEMSFSDETAERRKRRADRLRDLLTKRSGHSAYVLEDRIAMLVGMRAEVQVGGKTREEQQERLYRWRRAVRSAYFSIAHGVLVGGGVSLLRGRRHLLASGIGDSTSDAGVQAVCSALEQPLRALIATTNLDVDDTMHDLEESDLSTCGVDVDDAEITDLRDMGILDPAPILTLSIEKASTSARTFLQTETWQPAAESVRT